MASYSIILCRFPSDTKVAVNLYRYQLAAAYCQIWCYAVYQ